ncbi:protein kinase domain-containing protein [Cryptosporidium muris RN66]|uniref:Protein kinase domain-containing protein n=1 Tax=Cryptosporidium muris (strain RN66) TaxID=441375 RepID=B6AI86_CRYMR|nr:protein kinase domain-containing protein [Cryptosporidium muris RN66]EEA07927.1 protein kinase domain-containing protein [Cryptosporidium muris RN66]|eukprot:XP_002142276.1 protein kinase domain-containing protein [Cryptosporidium muris RN66]
MKIESQKLGNQVSTQKFPEHEVLKGNLESYYIVDVLQNCLYGRVYQGFGEISGDPVAVKVLIKDDISLKERNRSLPETPLAEVFFAKEMANHPHLASIRDVFETKDYHCIVSDLADGEDLLELLRKYRTGLPEEFVRICMKQAALALAACHDRGFALQDFSLENCLLFSVKDNIDIDKKFNNCETRNSKNMNISNENRYCKFQIKVCDPGQAIRFTKYKNSDIEVPVPYLGCVGKKFRPPEIFLRKPYIASKVDSWCLGWSTFYLMFGLEIFDSVYQIDNDIRWKWYSLGYRDYLYSYLGVKDRLSPIARSFIESLLDPNPTFRISVKQALNHEFLRDIDPQENLILENCGRSLKVDENFTGIDNIKYNKKNLNSKGQPPCIPDIYQTVYRNIYCSVDKPSGYIPSIGQNKNSITQAPNMNLFQKNIYSKNIQTTSQYFKVKDNKSNQNFITNKHEIHNNLLDQKVEHFNKPLQNLRSSNNPIKNSVMSQMNTRGIIHSVLGSIPALFQTVQHPIKPLIQPRQHFMCIPNINPSAFPPIIRQSYIPNQAILQKSHQATVKKVLNQDYNLNGFENVANQNSINPNDMINLKMTRCAVTYNHSSSYVPPPSTGKILPCDNIKSQHALSYVPLKTARYTPVSGKNKNTPQYSSNITCRRFGGFTAVIEGRNSYNQTKVKNI